jgi:polyhydroxyalkanoate synthesis regulator phasin
MSLSDTIEKLKGVEEEAKQLFEELKRLAGLGKDANKAQKNNLQKLADMLDENVRKASRERCEFEIEKLDKEIEKLGSLLAIIGLPKNIRDRAKAERGKKVARRGRLQGKLGSDFRGILTATEIKELDELVAKANKEVQAKVKAAEFLQTVLKIADISLSIAAKLAI